MAEMFEYWRMNKAASISAFVQGNYLNEFQLKSFRALAYRLGKEFAGKWQFHTRGRKMADFDIATIAHGEGAIITVHPMQGQLEGLWGRMQNPKPNRRAPQLEAIVNVVNDSSLVLFFPCVPAVTDYEYQLAEHDAGGKRGKIEIHPTDVSGIG